MELVLYWSYDTAPNVSEAPSLPLRDEIAENSNIKTINESPLQRTNMSITENQWKTPSDASGEQDIMTDTVANSAWPAPSNDMNHTPFLREKKRNGTTSRRKKQRTKIQPSAISMTTASKLHTTLPVMRSILRHMIAFVKQQIPQLIEFLKLVTSVLSLILRTLYTAMITVFIPFAKKEWQKYHPLIVLFCMQQQHTLIKHCTFLCIMVAKLVDQWKSGFIPEETGLVVETAATPPSSEINRPIEGPVLPYYLHAVVADTPEWLPNISVSTSVMLLNSSTVVEKEAVDADSSQNAIAESIETQVADWNDTITALVIRLSLIVIMCILIAISQ
jgi:hypothetical protein